mmetsp:Transcript_4103/g.8855  ORF Transcript_4103/g.8855 Transcript_4103/m.8855 type:complete len:282 (+) Transcript_4103:92-937(+)
MTDPFGLCVAIVDSAEFNLKELHLESRSNFAELDLFLVCCVCLASNLLECVVSKGNKVTVVTESQNAGGLRFGHREKVFENIGNTVSERSAKVVEDQVRVSFGHSAAVLNVMAHDSISERKSCGRSIGKMANHEGIRLTTVLLDKDNVSEVVCTAGIYKFSELDITTVNTLRIREEKSHLFCELLKARTWVHRCSDADFGVANSGTRVLVVDVALRLDGMFIIAVKLCSKLSFLRAKLGGNRLALRKSVANLTLLLVLLTLLALQGLAIQVLLAEANVLPH